MPQPIRVSAAIATIALCLTISGAAYAGPSASLEQVRNGAATVTTTPTPTWVSGNAGASNSHYLESHSIAYRTVMDQLPTDGSVVEIVLGYNVKRSGSYALDYLTHYQRVLPHVLFGHRDPEVFNPLAGITGVGSTVTTAPIPLPTRNVMVDPDGSESEPAALQPMSNAAALAASERAMTLFGGTLLDVSYVSEADVNLATSSSETQVKVRFIPNGPRAVLAWGGHIACRWDWGFNADGTPRSAGGISGSSYHMRLVNWTLGSLGNQDRSMSTDAVYPVPRCGVSNLGPFCASSTNTHTAPGGMESYTWELFNNTSGATIVGSSIGTSVTVNSGTAGGSYSLLLTTTASGFTKQCDATVTVNAPVLANAGLDLTVCATSPQVTLAGTSGGGTAAWTGGAGTFSPGRSDPNATYTPTAAEITAGGVTLTLTTTPTAGSCPAASDQVRITISRAATANAGADLVVCATAPQAQLAGIAGGAASGGTWSGGAGTFSPGASALNATYTPTAGEIAAGGVTLTLTTNDPDGPCEAVTDQVRITINPAATANAGADLVVCASAPRAQLSGLVGGAAASGTWSGGAGSFSPNASALNAAYTPTAGEIAAGGVTLTLTTNDPSGPCGVVSDQVRITINPAATVDAGANQTMCASAPQAQLAGVTGGGATSGTWSGGAGTFSPNASALSAIYTPSTSEIAARFVLLTLTTDDPAGPCGAVNDTMRVIINPAATANAGADLVVCASAPLAQLSGAVGGGAASGAWSGGAGTFSPNASALNATYTPTAAEIAAGGVTLTLTTNDPSGPCGTANDQVRITISPAATANAGVDLSVCSSSPVVQLAGVTGGGATSGWWSGGTGTFSPSRNAPDATYTPSAAEITAGSVVLTFVTNDPAGPCGSVSDQIRITISPAATVNAGWDRRVCASSPQLQLAGVVGGGASSGTWSGGAGTFSPNASALNATYTPSAGEVAAGTVTLTLTTNDPAGPCPAISDQLRITIDPITVVDAGLNAIVCASSPSVQLRGTVSGTVSTGTWSGGTGTFSPGASSLNATYAPSASEIAAGGVTLTLTSATPSGPCPPASDQVTIAINPAATVNAGPDQVVCAESPVARLTGSVGGAATGGTWSGGNGTFNPSASDWNPTYTPTASEIAAGSVTLTFTTNDPAGPCPAVSDQVKITINWPRVTVKSVTTCTGIAPVSLCANASGGSSPYTYRWSNGATSQCISVSDSGSYTVTITDARGCQASGTGSFHQRECVGMISHTSVTCGTFMDGTGDDLESGDINYQTRDNIITQIAPGVFFYWTKIQAPSADFTIFVRQIKDNPAFPFIPVLQGQVRPFDSNCSSLANGIESSPGQSTIQMRGAVPGRAYIVSVKYSLKALVGAYLDPNWGCHFDFRTEVNGTVVDQDPDGIQIGTPAPIGGTGGTGSGGTGGAEDQPTDPGDEGVMLPHRKTISASATPVSDAYSIEAYRPVPNPFNDGMRMAYVVGPAGERVSIRVFDVAGRLVRTLANDFAPAGRHLVTWDGTSDEGARMRNGMYFVHVRIGMQARQVRVTILK